jgi:hypothetical protein
MRLRAPLLPVAVVVVANLILLGGAVWNRRGEPESTVTLTERDLRLVPFGEENSGLALELNVAGSGFGDAPAGLDRGRLAELGFDTGPDPGDASSRDHYRGEPPRGAFVALEYRRNAAGRRLTVADIAHDAEKLRQRHPDTARFLIMRCVVRVSRSDGRLTGYVAGLRMPRIHVPLPYSRALSTLEPRSGARESDPRYSVTMCFGKRHEPWICGCELTAAATQ